MKNKFLIYFSFLIINSLLYDYCYSQNNKQNENSSIINSIKLDSSKLDMNYKDCTNNIILGNKNIAKKRDLELCGVENADDILIYPSFGMQSPGVYSPDICLESDESYFHSNISVFIDPNDKNEIRTSDMSVNSLYLPDGFVTWFNSEDRGINWTKGYLDWNNNIDAYSDPTTVINNNGNWGISFLDNTMVSPYYPNQVLSNVRFVRNINGNWDNNAYYINQLDNTYNYYSFERPHLMVDNTISSPYNGRLYCAYTAINKIVYQNGNHYYPACNQIELSRSLNDGVNWEGNNGYYTLSKSVFEPDSAFNIGVNIQTGPDGEVYAVWAAVDLESSSKATIFEPNDPVPEKVLVFNRSLDGGDTYGMVPSCSRGISIQLINGVRGYEAFQYGWPLGNTVELCLNSFPSMCVDKSVGPNKGTIYIVWAEHAINPSNSQYLDRIDIKIICSKDRGDTWLGPYRVNQNSWGIGEGYNTHSFSPWITCDEETGTLAVVFYDDRGYERTGFVNTYVALSKDYGITWEDCIVSDYRFIPANVNTVTNYFLGDHIAIASKNGLTYPIWTDLRLTIGDPENYVCRPEPYISPFYTWNCVHNYQDVVLLVPSWEIHEWEVSDYITARNTIAVNGLAVYNAGNEIRFLPPDKNFPNDGFWAQEGSFVHAYIEGCTPFSPNTKSLTSTNTILNKLLGERKNKTNSNELIKLYPNPCQGKFQVEMLDENNRGCSLEVTNSIGKVMFASNYSNQDLLNIDISNYPKGLYLLKIVNNSKTYTYKIIYI